MKTRLTVVLVGVGVLLSNQAAAAKEAPCYVLPFEAGAEHVLVQGNNGPYGHEGTSEFAFDFSMAIGTNVTAMRGGTVVKVVEGHADSEPRNPEPGNENYVVIEHGDGTFGRYYHLTQGGVDVAEGDEVEAAQHLGRSGNSGASFMPHLHVDVTGECFDWGCQTLAIRFSGVEDALVAGESYGRDEAAGSQCLPAQRE